MIGAMPSLALDRCSTKQQGSIGHLNRKNLSLHFRPPQLNSQTHSSEEAGQMARHCANKRLLFQLSVLAPLCGALLLFVGLVQLIPGADGEAFSLPLILIGSVVLFLGLFIILFRFCCNYEIPAGAAASEAAATAPAPDHPASDGQDTEIKIEDANVNANN